MTCFESDFYLFEKLFDDFLSFSLVETKFIK